MGCLPIRGGYWLCPKSINRILKPVFTSKWLCPQQPITISSLDNSKTLKDHLWSIIFSSLTDRNQLRQAPFLVLLNSQPWSMDLDTIFKDKTLNLIRRNNTWPLDQQELQLVLHELHLILGTPKPTIINLQRTPTTPKSISTLFEYAQLEPQHRNLT